MKYRPEIDGLRTLAVVPVLLFHAGFSLFSGGFVGVDIFFVISGYLISMIIFTALEEGRFSIWNFYERRARRILPALVFICLCCVPFAYKLMIPYQFKDFGESLIAVSFFASNILFWHETNYFWPAAEEKPLLHTWSLAVEEQYYLFFPLIAMALWRFGRRPVFYMFLFMALVSLALAEFGSRWRATANFFLLPMRFWELLVGVFCTLMILNKPVEKNSIFSMLGLILIVYSIVIFDKTTPFPSLWALIPVIGSALIILYAEPSTGIGKLLSTPIMVGIGLISYSLYLWHQPVVAFSRLAFHHEPETLMKLALLGFSFAMAYLSWRFVERPFRRADTGILKTSQAVFGASFISLAVLISIGFWASKTNAIYDNMPLVVQEIITDRPNFAGKARADCSGTPSKPLPKLPLSKCVTGPEKPIEAAMFGDSHIWPLFRGASVNGLNQYGVMSYYYIGCAPIRGVVRLDQGESHKCRQSNERMRDYIFDAKIPTVIFAARWGSYYNNKKFDNLEGGVELGGPYPIDIAGHEFRKGDDSDRQKRVLDQYIADIHFYLNAGINVILIYPIPGAGWDVPNQVIKINRFLNKDGTQNPISLSTSYEVYQKSNGDILEAFNKIEHKNFYPIRSDLLFCNKGGSGRCDNFIDGKMLYMDNNHLSIEGSKRLALPITKVLEKVRKKESP